MTLPAPASLPAWPVMRRGPAWAVRLMLLVLPGVAAAQSGSVAFRWTSGFGQGTMEAMIRAPGDTYLAFACPSGQADTSPSVAVQIRGGTPRGRATLQIVVDGQNHALGLEDGFARGAGRGAAAAVAGAAHALVRSKAATFTAEIPEIGWRQQFSLANVRDALGPRPGRTIIDECLR